MKFFLPGVFILLGILFTVAGAKILYGMILFKRSAIKTTGTVIKIKTSLSRAKNTTYSPVLLFKTIDGKEVIYDVDRYYFRKYSIGEQLEILYQKEKPEGAQLNTFKQIFLPALITLFLGLLGLGISGYLIAKK